MYKYFVSTAHCISWPWSGVAKNAVLQADGHLMVHWSVRWKRPRHTHTHMCAWTRARTHADTICTVSRTHIHSAVIWFPRRHDMNPINSGWGSIENHFHEGKLLLDFDSVSSAGVIWRWLRNERCKGALLCCAPFFFYLLLFFLHPALLMCFLTQASSIISNVYSQFWTDWIVNYTKSLSQLSKS